MRFPGAMQNEGRISGMGFHGPGALIPEAGQGRPRVTVRAGEEKPKGSVAPRDRPQPPWGTDPAAKV